MAVPHLPLDILVCILSHLPAERTRANHSARTLARFSTCCRLFNDAASLPTLWEPHYQMRFIQCNAENETKRRDRVHSDWKLMYMERRRLEEQALTIVRTLVQKRRERRQAVQDLVNLSMDVWDALSLERDCPLPPSFQAGSQWEPDHGKTPEQPLTWRYWSGKAIQIVTRDYATRELAKLRDSEADTRSHPLRFHDSMNLLSCFFGVPAGEVSELLDDLARRCVEYLRGLGLDLDQHSTNFNKMQVCRGIYQFMTDEGFSLAPRVHFRSLMNHFPHTYLTTNKSTIPISLVHIALHLARHVGLDVSPVNFPGTVLGRVETGDAQPDHFFLINPSAPDINDSILLPNFGPTLTLPGDAEQLILRASRNVEASLVEKTNQTREFASAAASCTVTIRLLLVGDYQDVLLEEWKQLLPIEYYALATTLSPLLDDDRKSYLEEFCRKGIEDEQREAFSANAKHHTDESVKHFVGMVFRHRREGYIACIIGWDEEFDQTTVGSVDYVHTAHVTRGLHQPFYKACLSTEDSTRYVAQEHVQKIALTADLAKSFVTNNSLMSVYFSDVQLVTEDNDRGVFKPSADLKQVYPDDEWYAARWVKEGNEAADEQRAAIEEFARQFQDYL